MPSYKLAIETEIDADDDKSAQKIATPLVKKILNKTGYVSHLMVEVVNNGEDRAVDLDV